METTPRTVKILSTALQMHGWEQNDLARLTGINRTQISFHLNGSRPVRDDHLALYITALDKAEQSRLVSAWLQDTLPAEAVQNVLEGASNSVREEVRAWRPGLTSEQADMIDWWAAKLAEDDELARIFEAITRKAGWQPDPVTHGTTLDHAEKVVFDIGKRLGQPPQTTPHPATDQPRSS
jgi:transcriptional regulator with XRE-family HTH domain